jgi:hypothetical protein
MGIEYMRAKWQVFKCCPHGARQESVVYRDTIVYIFYRRRIERVYNQPILNFYYLALLRWMFDPRARECLEPKKTGRKIGGPFIKKTRRNRFDPLHSLLSLSTIMSPLNDVVPPGVVCGDNLLKLMKHAKENGYAIPGMCFCAALNIMDGSL